MYWPAVAGRIVAEASSDHRLVWVGLARSSWDHRAGDAPAVAEVDAVAELASS